MPMPTTIKVAGIILELAFFSLKIISPIKVVKIILVSLIADAYAIGKYCIHQTTNPYARGAKIPKLVPLINRSLLIFLRPLIGYIELLIPKAIYGTNRFIPHMCCLQNSSSMVR